MTQVKDIPTKPILELLAKNPGEWHLWWESESNTIPSILPAFPMNTPPKLVLGKMQKLIDKGLVQGCCCGCRGDFEITEKGLKEVSKLENNNNKE